MLKEMDLKFRILMIAACVISAKVSMAQTAQQIVQDKVVVLQKLVNKADKIHLDASKEKATIRTAEVFFNFANYDDKNIAKNQHYFELLKAFKPNAQKLAQDLPAFERTEINLMLDDAIANINDLIAGKINRKATPNIDWSKLEIQNSQIIFNKKPVFLADYTWKPHIKELDEYFGNSDSYLISPNQVINEKGDVSTKVIDELKQKPTGTFGGVFITHKGLPKWAIDKYPNFELGQRRYTDYDIDNPGARFIQSALLKNTVPLMANKNYSKVGYMLTNEPHWFTAKNAWATGPVSEYTKAKFRDWLKTQHQSIVHLNKLWATNFTDFDAVEITIPIDKNLQGKPIWYDWVTFNSVRVTDWFTFLKTEIRKSDPNAKTHIKVMPNLWTENARDHGLDMENLVELTDVIGNDASSEESYMWGPKEEWQDKYAFNWRELSMSYDFFKSISPDKINYNSEGHFVSTTKSRNLYLSKEYTRASYWLAFTQGLNMVQTWYWPRNADGSIREKGEGVGYAASLIQQPRVVNEITTTLMDLNSHSEEITALQNLKKSIRIFYSKTSAINKTTHMDDIYHLYESLYFEGIPLGFATQNIIQKQNNKDWDVILVSKTPYVAITEFEALQQYLNNGGTVIIDNESLQKNQYGEVLTNSLKAAKGKLIQVNSLVDFKRLALNQVALNNHKPVLNISETNALNIKGCFWKSYQTKNGNTVLSIINLGKTDATLNIQLENQSKGLIFTDLLTGVKVSGQPILKPNQVYFVSVDSVKEKK